MKRVKAACITQTLHFLLNDHLGHDYAVQLVDQEVEKYKKGLEKAGTKFRILSEKRQGDGTVILEIKKQYSTAPVGEYLN